jgi:hypothetical protein
MQLSMSSRPMQGIRPQFVLLLLGLLCLPLSCPADAAQRPTQRKHAVKPPPPPEQVAPQPEPPPAPPRPLTLEERPAAPPQVAYHDGILTIIAPNSTLGDILRAVHTQTGAVIDMPGNTSERVVTRFGPGPARDVLAELLNGTHFNYAIVGSASDANVLERVILTPKSGDMPSSGSQPDNNAAQAGQPGFSPPQPRSPFAARIPQPANEDNDESDSDNNEDEQMTQPGTAPATPEQAEPAQPAIKTPEQLLQELQRQQQQLQQQPGAPQAIPTVPPRPSGPPPQQ